MKKVYGVILVLGLALFTPICWADFGVKDLDAAVGGYAQTSRDGEKSDRSNSYDWYDGSVFLMGEKNGGKWGIGANLSRWRGEAASGFDYHGQQWGIGPAYKFTDPMAFDLTFKFLYGQRKEEGDVELYQSHQKSQMVLPSFFFNYWGREKERWLPHFSGGLWAEIDVNTKKKSTWNNNELLPTEDPVQKKNAFGGSLRAHLFRGKFRPALAFEVAKRQDWKCAIFGVGLTDKNQILWFDFRRDFVNQTFGVAGFVDIGQFRRVKLSKKEVKK